MEINKILQADVLDIIFEQKNKQYGAYELRKNYHKRARKALMIAATFAFVATSVPLIAGLFDSDERITLREKIYKISEVKLPPENPVTPPNQHQQTATTEAPVEGPPVITRPNEIPEKPEKPEPSNLPQGPENPNGPEGPVTLNPTPPAGTPQPPVIEVPRVEDKTYESEDITQFPEFPGGEAEMMKFLQNNLRYPKRANEENREGRVVLEFVVDKEGNISEIDLLRAAGFGFDDEAKRVVNMMPNWKPGKLNGIPVKARLRIPIVFELEDK